MHYGVVWCCNVSSAFLTIGADHFKGGRSTRMVIAGWIILSLLALFLIGASATPKLLRLDVANKPMDALGFDRRWVVPIGILEVLLALGVLVPQTAPFSGILMMGLLGGAIAARLRINAPLLSHTLFGVYLGVAMWIGICLRDPRVFEVFINKW